RDDVPALLAAADVVAVPSRWEARALIVQEALRAGVPVVASRVGGTPGLTGPDAAILVSPEDAGALSEAILSVLDDPARAARLSEAARFRASELPSAVDAVTAVRAVYAGLLPRCYLTSRLLTGRAGVLLSQCAGVIVHNAVFSHATKFLV